MHTSAILLGAVAALISSADAATLYVDNYCKVPLYLRSSSAQTGQGPVITLTNNTINAYHETMRGPGYTQNALTISRSPTLSSPLQMGYTQSSNGLTYYDLSTIYGDPFKAQGFELISGGNGYSIKCPPRTNSNCPHTYNPQNVNGNDALFTQGNQYNMALRLCQYS